MCESEPAILPAVIVLLTVIILLLVYLLTEKICLRESNSSSLPDTKISSIYVTNSQRATRHPSQLTDRNYKVWHILCRRTPPPPKLNLPLINFGVINILWISARPPSRGQICGKSERLDRSTSYRGTTGWFNVLGCGGIRDRPTQIYRKSTRGRRPSF